MCALGQELQNSDRPVRHFMSKSVRHGIINLSCLFVLSTGQGGTSWAQGMITSGSNFSNFAPGQSDSPGSLSCGYDAIGPLGANHTGSFVSQAFTVTLSVDANYGSIGTGIYLTNNASGQGVNLVETRSGGGAAWQTSYYFYDQSADQLLVFNQGAGNSVGSQWGFGTRVTELTSSNWIPLWSDHIRPDFKKQSFSGSQTGTSPCLNTSYAVDEGRNSLNATPIETPLGTIVHVVNNYQLKSRWPQNWPDYTSEQALYLSAQTARSGDLRVYLKGTSGWLEGPIRPYERDFSVNPVRLREDTVVPACSDDITNGVTRRCGFGIAGDLSYTMFIYNIFGLDIGVVALAIPGQGADLNNETAVLCNDYRNDNCNSINFHTYTTRHVPVSFPVDHLREHKVEYYIGTLPQLGAIGFNLDLNPPHILHAATGPTGCYAPNFASSNDELPQAPAQNIVTGYGFYSSASFPNSSNNRNSLLTASTGNNVGVGSVRLTPRVLNNGELGFPDLYRVYLADTANANWIYFGTHNAQPIGSATDIMLGYPLQSSNLMVIPTTLQTDNYGGYYFQLAGLKACN